MVINFTLETCSFLLWMLLVLNTCYSNVRLFILVFHYISFSLCFFILLLHLHLSLSAKRYIGCMMTLPIFIGLIAFRVISLSVGRKTIRSAVRRLPRKC
jgi:hypothetical protein